MWVKPNGAFCGDARAEWRPPKRGATVRWKICSTLCSTFVWPLSFISYYFLEFGDFIFYFQETYNNWLKERYKNNPSTHPDFDSNLWMEAGSSGGPDRNWVYKLSNTTIENLRTTCSVSTIGSSQSIPSIQAPKFAALIHQGVQEHTTHLNEKYKWLSTDYEDVTAWPNLPDIVRFGPYRPYGFVLGDHIWPQNASDKSATYTINKASYQIFTRWCEILQSTPLRSLTTPSAQPDNQWDRLWYQM